jgi:hypothetical protein
MKARIKLNRSMGNMAKTVVLVITGYFDLLISNSSEPSRTIRISPRVPSIGSIEERLGMGIEKKVVACFTSQPNSRSKITDGILVLEELISNTYARSNKRHREIITETDICKLFNLINHNIRLQKLKTIQFLIFLVQQTSASPLFFFR